MIWPQERIISEQKIQIKVWYQTSMVIRKGITEKKVRMKRGKTRELWKIVRFCFVSDVSRHLHGKSNISGLKEE